MESTMESEHGGHGRSGDLIGTSALLGNPLPFFSLWENLDVLWPTYTSLTCLIVTFMQPIAFSANTRWGWGWLMGRLSEGIYIFILPFWDPAYKHTWGYEIGLAAFWVVIAVLMATSVMLALFYREGCDHLNGGYWFVILRLMLHASASVLTIPFACTLLAGMVCDRSQKSLWLYPSVECWGIVHTVHLVVGVLGFLILVCISLPVRTMLFCQSPFSLQRWARAHTILDLVSLVYDLMTPILYFALLSSQHQRLFAGLHAFNSVCLGFAYCFIQPYYSQRTNLLRATGYFIAGFVSALTVEMSWELVSRDLDAMVVALGSMLCWFFALSLIRRLRVPKSYLAASESVDVGWVGGRHVVERFPLGLPRRDLEFSNYRHLEKRLVGMQVQQPEEGMEEPAPPDPLFFNVSMVHKVYFCTDVELACRFLRLYCLQREILPEKYQLGYYARVYTKGLCKFGRSNLVHLHFVMFLHYYCQEHALALHELRRLLQKDLTIPLMFCSFRLGARLKLILNIKDNSHHKTLLKAHKLYVQTLGFMTLFWTKLMAESFDSLDLAMLADTITEKREEGLKAFELAITTRFDKTTGLKYAQFLEQVMLDEAGAQSIRSAIKDTADNRTTVSSKASEGIRMQLEATKKASTSKMHASKAISTLNIKMNVMFLLFFLIACGFGVFQLVMTSKKKDFIKTMDAAGKVRNLVQYTSYMSSLLIHTATHEKATDSNCMQTKCTSTGLPTTDYECSVLQVFPQTARLRGKLRQITTDLRVEFNSLSSGEYKTSYTPLVKLFKDPRREVEVFHTATESKLQERGVWEIINLLLSSLETLLEVQFSPMINASMVLYEKEFEELLDIGLYVTTCLFSLSLFLVFIVYLILELSFLKIGGAKMETLNLFSLIPKNTLQTIHSDSKERLARYEVLENEDDTNDSSEEQASAEVEKSNVSGAFKIFLKHTSKGDGKVIKHNLADDVDDELNDNEQEVEELKYIDDPDLEEAAPLTYQPPKTWPRRFAILIRTIAFVSAFVCMAIVIVLGDRVDDVYGAVGRNHEVHSSERELGESVFRMMATSHTFVESCSPLAYARYQEGHVVADKSEWFSSLHDSLPTSKYADLIKLQEVYRHVVHQQEASVEAMLSYCTSLGHTKPWQTAGAVVEIFSGTADAHDVRMGLPIGSLDYESSLGDLLDLLTSLHGPTPDVSTVRHLGMGLTVCLGLLSFSLLFIKIHLEDESSERDCLSVLCHLILGVMAVMCVVSIFMSLSVADTIEDVTRQAAIASETILGAQNSNMHLIFMRQMIENWMRQHNPVWMEKYLEVTKEKVAFFSPYHNIISQAVLVHSTFEDDDVQFAAESRLPSISTDLRYLEGIAIVLYSSGAALPLPERFEHFAWDKEADGSRGFNPSYVNHHYDLNRTKAEQRELANEVLFSDHYNTRLNDAQDDVTKLAERILIESFQKQLDNKDRLDNALLTMTVLQIIVIAFLSLLGIRILVTTMRERVATTSGKQGRDPDVLFAKYTTQVKVSLALVATLMIIIFALTAVHIENARELPLLLDRASKREWFSSKSAYITETLLSSSGLSTEVNLLRVGTAIESLRSSMDDLYFKNSDKLTGTVATDLFGHDTSTMHRMACKDPDRRVDSGSDIQTRQYIQLSRRLIHSRSFTDKSVLEDEIQHILTLLQESTLGLEKHANDELAEEQFVVLVVLVVTALLLIVESVFIFRPMAFKLLQQEEGTKLMLKMIPEKERKTVGAIVQFLETGQISSNKKLAEVNEVVTKISTIPTVVCDSYGTIALFSRAAQDVFGWSDREAVNENVKMLMPEEYSTYHDLYLARYRKTGVKRIIGSSRNVSAHKKDGTVFPVNIAVKEFRQGRKSVYIGFITDISLDIETERMNQLNNATSKAGATPVICIDLKGTIVRWNRAASDTFGYSSKEALKHNVKMLMKPETAEMHDQYLERYKRTARSKWVGTGQKLHPTGVKKNGETFSVELYLEEVRLSEQDVIIIGNVRDVTEEFLLGRQTAVHENIIKHSPIPLIVINIEGTVLKFSPAAERQLGYKQSEVVGQNVTMLQTPEYASIHDQILAKFAKTGLKKVIGSTRSVEVKRRDGTIYHASLKIQDAVSTDPKFPTVFIGYLVSEADERRQNDLTGLSETTIDLCPMPLIVIHTDGIIDVFSSAAQVMSGYSKEETVGHNVSMIMHPEIAENHNDYLIMYQKTGVSKMINTSQIVKMKKKDGAFVPVLLCLKEVKTRYGNRYFAYLSDQSTRLETERINEIGSAIVSLCPVPLICISAVGQIRLFSQSACQKFGWLREDIMYKNVKVLMDEEIASQHDGYLSAYRETGKGNVIDKILPVNAMRKDNSFFPVELKVSEFKQDGNSFFVGFLQDITEKKSLLVGHMASQAVLEGSRSAVFAINQQGIIQLVSEQGYTVFGYEKGSLLGKNLKCLMPDQVAEHHDGYLRKYLKTGIQNVIGKDFTATAKRSDGKEFPCEISIREKSVVGKNGEHSLTFVGYITDNSDQYIIQQNSKLNNASQDLVTFPLIVITITGKIVSYNEPAAMCFDFREDEAVGSNVKMLMPSEIAEQHDSYLTRYRKTGVKHIIDSSRMVTGQKKGGAQFPLEVFVREVQRDGQTTFYGNLRDVTEQQEVEFQREIIESVVRQADIAIITINEIGIIGIFNRASEAMFGYHARDVIDKNVTILQPPEIAVNHGSYLASYIETGVERAAVSRRSVVAKRKNGKSISVALQVDVIRNNGKTTFVAFVLDESGEKTMMRKELTGKALLKGMLVPSIRIRCNGIVEQISDSVVDTFGYTEEELVGHNIKMLQPPEVAAEHDNYLARYLQTGITAVLNTTRSVQGRHKDGSLFNALVSAKEIKTGNSAEPYFVGYIKDLRPEEAVAKSRAILDEIVNVSPDGLIQIDTHGIIKQANLACVELLNYDAASDLLGKNITVIQPPEVAEHHDEYLARYVETGKKSIVDSVQLLTALTKDGELRKVFVTVREVQIEGMTSVFVGFLRDAATQLELEKTKKVREVSIGSFPYPCVVIDNAGVVEVASDSYSRLFGVENPKGTNISSIMPPDVAIRHDTYLDRYEKTGKKKVLDTLTDLTAISSEGERIPTESWITEVRIDDKRKFIGYLRDLKPQQEAAAQTKLMDLLSDLSPVAIMCIDSKGTILKANTQAVRITERSLEELLSLNIRDCMPEPYRSEHDGYLKRYMDTRDPHVIGKGPKRVSMISKSGAERRVSLRLSEIELNLRDPVFLGSITDVTELVHIEYLDRLNNGVEKLCNEGIISINLRGQVLRYNSRAQDMFGYAEADVLGKNIKMLMPDSLAEQHDAYLTRYSQGRAHSINDATREGLGQHQDGSTFKAVVRITECKTDSSMGTDDEGVVLIGFIRALG